MRISWIKLLGALLGIWLIVGGAIFWARSVRATPESVLHYLETHPMAGKSPAQRGEIVEKLAGQINQFNYDQRREMRMGKKLNTFFRDLTPAEQGRYLDLTLPMGFHQMMESLNKMTPEKRKEFVDKAVADMKKHEGEDRPDGQMDANSQKIVDQGLKSFYSDANAQVKMDMAPLIEQLQRNMQGPR